MCIAFELPFIFPTAQIDNIDFCTVLDVQCGLYHTVLITSTGLVLAWGDNSYGQLTFIDTKYERIARWGEWALIGIPFGVNVTYMYVFNEQQCALFML